MQTRFLPTATNRLPVTRILLLTTGAALVAGVAQVLVVFVRRLLLNEFTFTSRDVVWMAPLSNLLLVVPLAVVLVLTSRLVPRRPMLLVSAWLCACYSAYAMMLLFPQLHQIAMVIVSLGAAFRFTAAIRADPDRWMNRLRRVTMVLTLAIVVLTVVGTSSRLVREKLAMGALAEPEPGAPNVLVLILDTVRATNLDVYGYERNTSAEISRRGAEGAVFNWAIAPSSWTLPSHSSMFTGRRPDELSARFLTPLDAEYPTLAEVLRDHGFATAGFVANVNYASHESGLERGFNHYADYRSSIKEALLTGTVSRIDSFRDAWRSLFWHRSVRGAIKAMLAHHFVSTVRYPDFDRKDARAVNDEFLRWQSSVGDRPFFAFLNYFDAHTPYRPPEPFRSRFSADSVPQDLYDGAITYIDHELARLFEELSRRGVLDSTIVVITADHGEQFGEHGKQQHANSLYTQVLRVPLVIRFPGRVAAGVRIDRITTLQDLPATILAMAGVDAGHKLGGVSFASSLAGEAGRPGSQVLAELEDHVGFGTGHDTPEIRALFDDSLHYIVAAGAEQLYAYRSDPLETMNLAVPPRDSAELSRLRARLRQVSGSAPYVLQRRRDQQ